MGVVEADSGRGSSNAPSTVGMSRGVGVGR